MRFGQGLIQSLINPSYGQGLFTAGQGMGQIAAGIPQQARQAQEQQQQGMESLMAQAVSGDLSNPSVMKGMFATASQMNIDPEQVLDITNKVQTQKIQRDQTERAAEAAARDVELQPYRVASAKYQQRLRESEEQQRAIKGEIVRRANTPKAVEAYINTLPTEEQGYASEAWNKYQVDQSRISDAKQKIDENKPMEDISSFTQVLGEDYKEIYRKRASVRPSMANRLLLQDYEAAQKEKFLQDRTVANALNKAPTAKELEMAEQVVEDADLKGLKWGSDFGKLADSAVRPVVQMFRLGAPLTPTNLEKLKENLAANKKNPLEGIVDLENYGVTEEKVSADNSEEYNFSLDSDPSTMGSTEKAAYLKWLTDKLEAQ